jgi:exodeoxyribonuclease V gamma subunit
MLYIRFSNRFEILLDALLERMQAAVSGQSAQLGQSVFTPVEVLVPSAAVRRRIELAVADRFGICANVHFSFLAQWLWQQIGKLVAVPAESPFAPPLLAWRIYELFAQPALLAENPRLAAYLHEADPAMRMELASRTAALFDQYLTYRPDWMAQWLQGGAPGQRDGDPETRRQDRRWQKDLWRRIAADLHLQRHHPAEDFFERMAQLDDAGLLAAGLPQRVQVFCPPAIPPLYLEMLRRLGTRIEVELYVQNPCEEYWFEIVDRRRLSYLASRQQDLYQEVGNRLLAAWGKQSQAFIDLLLEDEGQAVVAHSVFDAPAEPSLLGQLQAAVLELRELEPGSVLLDADDRSIEVHACHTLTRELEVLHDQLLAQFAAADSKNPLRPSEILVVTPNLEQAAPLIDAVFGSVPAARRIPYAISGRPGSLVNPVARALLDLLALAASRYQASAVFGLLQQPLIAQRFGLGAGELDTIRDWLVEAGIHWGIDAGHRTQYGLPKSSQHSFRDGLQRLFLGYALPSAIGLPFHDRVAAGHPEGGAAAALGSFHQFFTQLELLHSELAEALLPDAWRETLLAMLETFIAVDHETIDDLREVQHVIGCLASNMHGGGVKQPVPATLVQSALQGLLDEPTMAGTPTGSVTFAAMASLRALPYRMICVIGMRDGAFPTASRPAEFDLMPPAPRRGDRQRGHEERNLFFDLLLAARERFYVSYTGNSVRDNASLPPSVLVADLLDYLVPAIAADPHSADSLRAARARLLLEHPLQPFSARYFDRAGDPRLASFNDEYCSALQMRLAAAGQLQEGAAAPDAGIALGGGTPEESESGGEDERDDESSPQPLPPFFVAELLPPEAEWRTVSMEQLLQFFRNPCSYLLRYRLGIGLAGSVPELADDEPLLPEFSSRRELAARLLPHLLAGMPTAAVRTLARAGLEYPGGALGQLQLDGELQALARFAELLRARTQGACLPPLSRNLDFDLDGEHWQLQLALGDLRAEGLVRYRYDDARAADYLAGWLHHLFLNAAGCKGAEPATHWIARDGAFQFEAIDDALPHLRQLLRLYRHGLCRPLPFYPKSSWEYVDNKDNIRSAQAAWHGSMQHPYGEERHLAYQLALRGGADPLGPEFERTAKLVYEPLLRCLKDPRRP